MNGDAAGPSSQAAKGRKLASVLRDVAWSVSIKATTTERLGFTGRSEGLAAQAAATIRLPTGEA